MGGLRGPGSAYFYQTTSHIKFKVRISRILNSPPSPLSLARSLSQSSQPASSTNLWPAYGSIHHSLIRCSDYDLLVPMVAVDLAQSHLHHSAPATPPPSPSTPASVPVHPCPRPHVHPVPTFLRSFRFTNTCCQTHLNPRVLRMRRPDLGMRCW
jgi:hypothetical protein